MKAYFKGLIVGVLAVGSLLGASEPKRGLAAVERKIRITDDTRLYKRLSETRVKPAQELAFESDIAKLAALEEKYDEKLSAHPRLRNSVSRVSKMKYRTRRN